MHIVHIPYEYNFWIQKFTKSFNFKVPFSTRIKYHKDWNLIYFINLCSKFLTQFEIILEGSIFQRTAGKFRDFFALTRELPIQISLVISVTLVTSHPL